jgi:hypothetical protein
MESKAQFNSLLSSASLGAAAAVGGSTGGEAAAAGAAGGADPMKQLLEKLRRCKMFCFLFVALLSCSILKICREF